MGDPPVVDSGAVIDAGAAWYEPGVSGPGRVVAVFARAAYLRFGPRILAVGSGAIPSGPLHLRTPRFAPALLRVGDSVRLGSGRLRTGELSVDVGAAPRWIPPDLDAEALAVGLGLRPAGAAPGDIGLEPGILAEVARAMAGADLVSAAWLLGGRGPGLTPSGDDVLAGALVTDALLRPHAGARRRAAVSAARTNDVTTAFLRWAAVGQSIRPVHDLLGAIASRDPVAQAAATAEVMAIGASSGEALLTGVEMAALGSRALPLHRGAMGTQRGVRS